jgi:hypothetical protein
MGEATMKPSDSNQGQGNKLIFWLKKRLRKISFLKILIVLLKIISWFSESDSFLGIIIFFRSLFRKPEK